MNKLEKIVSYFLLVFSLFMCGLVDASTDINQKINKELNHANSYYWLARGTFNHPYYLDISLEYIENARHIAESNNDVLDSLSFLKISNKIQLFKTEVLNAIAVSNENLIGKYRLYQSLFGESNYFEEFDDPMEIAVEKSLDKLININTISPSKPLRDLMNYSIIKTIPEDPNLLEVSTQLLSSFTNTYVISQHEQFDILNKIDGLKSNINFKEIARYFNVENVGEFKIKQLDNINNLSYASSSFKLFNPQTNKVKSYTKSESIVIDKRGVSFLSLFNSITYYFVTSFVLIFLVYFVYRKEKLYFLSFLSSSFLSVVFSFILIHILSLVALPLDSFSDSVNSKLFSFLVSFTISIVGFVLTILSLLLLFKRLFLKDSITATLFFFGASVGGLLTLNYHHFLFYEFNFSSVNIILQFLVLFISSIFFSKDFIKFDKQLDYSYLIKSTLSLVPIFLIYENTLLNTELISLFSILSYSLLFFGIYLIDKFYLSFIKTKKTNILNTDLVESFEDKVYSYLKAEKFLKLDYTNTQLDYFHTFLKQNESLNVLCVSGNEGIGKTTYFKSLKEHHGQFYYCDCDDINDDTSSIPYEPFLEAFSPFIGEGIFYNADRHSKNILKRVSPMIEDSLVGGKLLTKIIDNESSFIGANIEEILKEIEDHFVSSIKVNGIKDFVFCIDNYHWIDKESKELLQQFYGLLSKIKNLYRVNCSIIIISDKKIILDDELVKNKLFEICNFNIEECDLFIGEDFYEKLFNDFSFDYNSKAVLTDFFKDLNFNSPKYILQSLLFLSDNSFIENKNNRLVLSSNKWIETLPIPGVMKEAFHNQLADLDRKQMRLVELASFIGYKFEASIISSVWNIDRLEVIDNLRELEKNKIIIDISEENDYYKFSSKSLYKFIYNSISTHGENNLSQIAKEYHICICDYILEDIKADLETYDLDILIQIANRYEVLKEDYPVEFFKVNYFVAKRLFEFSGTSTQFVIHITRLYDHRSLKVDPELLIKSFCLYLKYIVIIKDYNDNTDEIFSLIKSVISHLKNYGSKNILDSQITKEFYLDSSEYLFQNNKISSNADQINRLRLLLSGIFNTLEDKIIQDFYQSLEHNEPISKYIDLRQQMIDHNSSTSIIYGRILNQLSANSKYPDSLTYYFERINQILISTDASIIIDDENCIEKVKNQYNLLNINRREDINYSIGGISWAYFKSKNFHKSFDYARLAYELNKKMRSSQGVSIYGVLTGDCLVRIKTSADSEIEDHFEELFYTLDSYASTSIESLLLVIIKWISFYESNNLKSDKLKYVIDNFDTKYCVNNIINIKTSFLFRRDSDNFKLFSELQSNNSFINFLTKIEIFE